MNENKEKNWLFKLSFFGSIISFVGLGFWVYFYPPDIWWSVLVFFLLFFLAFFLFVFFVSKKARVSVFISLFFLFVALLRFFGLANIFNLALLVLVLVAFWFSVHRP